MTQHAAKFFGFSLLSLLLATKISCGQDATATLSGIVTDSSGMAVANANLAVRNLSTGASYEARTNSSGSYMVPELPAGDYEISASAGGVGSKVSRVTLALGAKQTLNLALTAAPPLPPPAPPQSLPNAPSSAQTPANAPSLEDLGFSKSDTQANARQQALLDRRTRLLKIHQRMGLITTIPMIASVVTSLNAGGRSEGTASRDLHVALGALTGDLYGITAYYAIRAPRIAGTETRGPIKVHKVLAWVHGPGMVLTPILGAIAFSQKNNGEKVHGIAAAHGPVAIVTAGAFGAALLSVSAKF
jgi:Carboxypeptidase regulatory-like domain